MNKPDDAPALSTIRLADTVRNLRYVNFFLLLVIGILSALLLMTFPLKEKELVILEVLSEGQDVVRVHKAGAELQANELLHCAYLQKYIESRHVIDHITEASRYQVVKSMSGQRVWQVFQDIMDRPDSILSRKELRRSVTIKRNSILEPGIAQVEFDTLDSFDDSQKETHRSFVATIYYTFQAQEMKRELTMSNPLGLIVMDYNVSEREK